MLGLSSKIRAGALQFSILISVVIALIISAFILLTHIQLKFSKQLALSGRTIALSKNGITYAQYYDTPYTDSITTSLIINGVEEEFITQKTHWGLFDKIWSKGTIKNFEHSRIALLGGRIDSINRLALYLEDNNAPLVVAGKTKIIGNVVVPSQGVKPGNIVGNYYQGNQLIYGKVSKVASQKPSLTPEKRIYIEELLFNSSIPLQEAVISLGNTISNHTFSKSPQWIFNSGVVTLANQSITNNIIVKSDSLIRVSAFAKAKNIILIAPHIIIEKNATVSLQAFASKSMTIEENARLSYPSALIFMEGNQNLNVTENTGIVMEEGSVVEGSVVHLSANDETIRKPKLVINEGALIKGEVYSDEWIELFGTVEGTVYASELAARVRGSVYKNHLFNASINGLKLPENYSGLLTSESNKSIVQWVF